jgi:hypothetical protein
MANKLPSIKLPTTRSQVSYNLAAKKPLRFHIISLQRTGSKYLEALLHNTLSHMGHVMLQQYAANNAFPLGEFLHSWSSHGYVYHKTLKSPLGNKDSRPQDVLFHTSKHYRRALSSGNYTQFIPYLVEATLVGQIRHRQFPVREDAYYLKYTQDSLLGRLNLLHSAYTRYPDSSSVLKTQLASILTDTSLYNVSTPEATDSILDFHRDTNTIPVFLRRPDFTGWVISNYLAETTGMYVPGNAMNHAASKLPARITIPQAYIDRMFRVYSVHLLLEQGQLNWEVGNGSLTTTDLNKPKTLLASIGLPCYNKVLASTPQQLEFSSLVNYQSQVENLRDIEHAAFQLKALEDSL